MSYNYQIPDFADQWVSRTATKEEQYFDKLDATGVLRVVTRAMASDAEIAATNNFHQVTLKDFKKLNQSYIDNDHNAQAMQLYWQDVLHVTIPTLEQLEQCFYALRERGLLQLDAKAVAREDAAEVAQRTDELRNKRKAAEFNEDAAYGMSMADLEARCRGWK